MKERGKGGWVQASWVTVPTKEASVRPSGSPQDRVIGEGTNLVLCRKFCLCSFTKGKSKREK